MEDCASAQRVRDKLERAMGPQLITWLQEPAVVEIWLNADGTMWVARLGQGKTSAGTMEAGRAETLIANVATCEGTTVTRKDPLLECTLPFNGARFSASIPPESPAATFNIRRPAQKIYSLDDYVQQGTLSATQRQHLREAVQQRKNIVVAGGTGSGKTTFINAVIDEMGRETPEDRLVIIQDTAELQAKVRDQLMLFTSPRNDMNQLLRHTLRRSPDRIVVGEVRGAEALSMLKAWNTGHDGGATSVHANDSRSTLIRLEQLVLEGSMSPCSTLIADAVDIIVNIVKTTTGRTVREIVAVHGYRDGEYLLEELQ